MGLDNRVKLLDHIEHFNLLGKLLDHPDRHRMDHPELEDTRLRERLFDILITDAGSHNADLWVSHLDPVQPACLGKFSELLHPFLDKYMPSDRIGRHHYIFFRVLCVQPERQFGAFPCLDNALRVRHTGTGTQNDWGVELLGNLISCLYKVDALL